MLKHNQSCKSHLKFNLHNNLALLLHIRSWIFNNLLPKQAQPTRLTFDSVEAPSIGRLPLLLPMIRRQSLFSKWFGLQNVDIKSCWSQVAVSSETKPNKQQRRWTVRKASACGCVWFSCFPLSWFWFLDVSLNTDEEIRWYYSHRILPFFKIESTHFSIYLYDNIFQRTVLQTETMIFSFPTVRRVLYRPVVFLITLLTSKSTELFSLAVRKPTYLPTLG